MVSVLQPETQWRYLRSRCLTVSGTRVRVRASRLGPGVPKREEHGVTHPQGTQSCRRRLAVSPTPSRLMASPMIHAKTQPFPGSGAEGERNSFRKGTLFRDHGGDRRGRTGEQWMLMMTKLSALCLPGATAGRSAQDTKQALLHEVTGPQPVPPLHGPRGAAWGRRAAGNVRTVSRPPEASLH